MKKIILLMSLILIVTISCNKAENLEVTNDSYSNSKNIEVGSDYIDGVRYSLEEFISLNQSEYGQNFIDENINNIINNIHSSLINNIGSGEEQKVKFKFRWDGCDPFGACLTTSIENQDSDLTECVVKIVDNHLIVIPNSNKNGMMSDGYIFVDTIYLDAEMCAFLNVSEGTTIKSGIYKSQIPTKGFKYGYHIFDLI